MKVRFVGYKEEERNRVFRGWLKSGRIYDVVSINWDPGTETQYGILTGEEEGKWPSLTSFPHDCFQLVDGAIPRNWRFLQGDEGGLRVAPAAWQTDEFEIAFYDHDPSVWPIFERELKTIREASGDSDGPVGEP